MDLKFAALKLIWFSFYLIYHKKKRIRNEKEKKIGIFSGFLPQNKMDFENKYFRFA